ncbi:RNA polymerase III transcription factor IIIC subunit-domain-containing protein [Russula earlei]|uniref:RNA polymerase III transcription factor IIIC subunit-domain-containing protein n=1 Tax=Russula earlei TaxID=71964 RepID=A0ACC0UAK0_9AGAM|nr:RNA polymerase III transcription factor IIIC subunit-domain-containing protein [Russula earlei]
MDPTDAASPPKCAPAHELPTVHFYSVEYPGYVRPQSVGRAIRCLGGQPSLDRAFRRSAPKEDSLLELNLRPDDPFSHPLPGDLVPTNNILLRVVKRKFKRPPPSPGDGVDDNDNNHDSDGDGDGGGSHNVIGEYTAVAVGVIPKTARFRSMADFQYRPAQDDLLSDLRRAMTALDVEGIRGYRFPQETEDYSVDDPSAMDVDSDPPLVGRSDPEAQHSTQRSNLRLFPPPIFSRQGISQNYNFKANPMSTPTTVVNENTGEEKTRLINKARWKGYGPTSVSFAEKGVGGSFFSFVDSSRIMFTVLQKVPTKAPSNVQEVRNQYDQVLVQRLEELFHTRPVWTRAALLNQFTPAQAREIHNSKVLLPLTCYVFGDGPWRDTMVRFGFDPRQDPQARFYQKLYFRNLNHPIGRASVVSRRQDSRTSVASMNRSLAEQTRDDRRSHIFDGVTLSSETAAFQLCDITDPMLKRMIDEEDDIRESCNERDGWFTSRALERIKAVLRHKFFALLEGYVATDEECLKLLEQQDGTKAIRPFARRPRPGKHNMAKGAMPVEDAAVLRLRATLERNAALSRSALEPTTEGG